MSSSNNRASNAGRAKKWVAVLSLLCLALSALPAGAQQPLSFFKNYFVTGDYVVRGVSLWRKGVNGKAVADIPPLGGPGGVPTASDIVAAFLYVQTAEIVQGSGIDHAKFMGVDLGPFTAPGSTEPGSGTFAKALVPWDSSPPPCWSVLYPGGRKLVTYRVDAFRFLPIDPATGKQSLTTPFRIEVPDAGRLFGDDNEGGTENGSSLLPRAIGTSLVVVYRDPSKPLSAIVLYDGAYRKRAYDRMEQTIEGFYQSSLTNPSAKMTHIAGDGRVFLFERVFLNGTQIAFNPYVSALGPKWDNPTFSNLPLPGNVGSTTVAVDRYSLLSDCLTFSGMAFRTTVQDTDGDALLDRWETSPPASDPTGRVLPPLAEMGANPLHKDLFVEIAYMFAAEGTTYGGVPKPQHTHLLTEKALSMAAEAFHKAPVSNPDLVPGINVHFDIGANYQPPLIDPSTGLAFPPLPSALDCQTNWQPRCAIIPANLATGGESISETRACPDPNDPIFGQPVECLTQAADGTTVQNPIPGQYPEYPGTVGWKTGFQLLRDELLGFDRNRKDMFHFLLSGHFVGIPMEACQNPDGTSNFECQDTDPDFHVPRTNSGIADFPGGDFYMALGAFDNENKLPVGTDFMQGGTLMHELGHNYELTHAGLQSLNPLVPREPNCKPHYLSVMNYLYQLRGLPDANGFVQMDYSGDPLDLLNETSLVDGLLFPALTPKYRAGWYAPKAISYLNSLALAATKHCDGTELSAEEEADRLAGGGMVRVDAPSVGFPIDWNADGVLNAGGVNLDALQDINFNGSLTPLNPAPNDWIGLRLNQIGGRRNVGGYYIDSSGRTAVGPLSLDVGRGDIGRGDIGRGDIGRGDIGRGDIGRGDIGAAIGRGDIGRGDIGRGDIGRGDIGRGDIGRGDIGRGVFGGGDLDVGGANEPFGELDLETARAVSGDAPSPPKELQACLTTTVGEFGYVCAVEGGGDLPVRLDWQAPHLANAVAYYIYRFEYDAGAVFPPGTLPTEPIATLFGEGAPPTTYIDFTAAGGVNYAYFVIAQFEDESFSGISNFATVATPLRTEIASLDMSSTTLTVDGANVPYTAVLTNGGATTLSGVLVQAYIDQGNASRAAGGALVNCTATEGDLPPGRCTFNFTVRAFNEGTGTGTLVAGAATARFELRQGEVLLDTHTVPVTLVISGSGTIADASGDAGEGPDLVSATVLIANGNATLQVRFAVETFNPTTGVAQFVLDTDQNAATGHGGSDAGCTNDAGVIGAEYIVELGSAAHGTQAAINPFVGPDCNQFGGGVLTDAGSVVYVPNGMDVTFPLALIGGDDGLLNFKVISFTHLGGGSFSGVQDYMTNVGQAPGVVVQQ